MIEIDGSYLEGGGQILRTAFALSAATQQPCHVFNIRKGVEKSGLLPQHLSSLQAFAQLCYGKLEGDELGSKEIKFYPGNAYQDKATINISSAESVTIVLQTLIPLALLVASPIKIILNGGATDTFFSPTMDYCQYVFLKVLEKMGLKAEINIISRGYYPEGGAKVEATIFPSESKPLRLAERGKLNKVLVISGASELLKDKKVAERQLAGAREVLGKLKLPTEERIEYYNTQCPGSQICLIAEFENTVIGSDGLGRLDKRAEDVGKEAALELLREQKGQGCLDRHLADQILPYLALTAGKSQVIVSEITNHAKTNIWVIEKFLRGRFVMKGNEINWAHLR